MRPRKPHGLLEKRSTVARTRVPPRGALVTLLVALAGPVLPAIAVAAPSATDKETARSLLLDGDRKFTARDFAGALASYQAADAIMKVPTTGVEVAKAQEALGQLVEARDTLLAVLREPPAAKQPAAFLRAREEAEASAASLADRIPSIHVVVSGVDASVARTVRIDGEAVPAEAVSLPRKLNPGPHRVEVSAPGFRDAALDVTVTEGQALEQQVTLVAAPSGAPRPPVPAAEEATAAPVAPDASRTSPWVYVGFGVGAAGAVAGSITGAMSLSKTSSLKDHCPGNVCPPQLSGERNTASTLATIADVSFAAGIVGAAVGVVALLTGAKHVEEKPRAVTIHPWVSFGSVGLTGGFE